MRHSFGFVELADEAAAQKAINKQDCGTFAGRTNKVMEVNPIEDPTGS